MSNHQPFLNIRTEGALLPSDLLSRMVEGTNLPGLKPEDYHLGVGEKLNESISRSWTRLLALWAGFGKAKAGLPASDLGTTLTRERWLLQLFQELGYGRLLAAHAVEIDGKSYPISHRWQGQYFQVPIHLVSFRADLDKRSEQRIQGASKASPHGMVQEFLNRTNNHLWAFVSNGLRFLILRDNVSLTRLAYVEFDLEGIFEIEAYADFRLFWMLCHQSRVEGTAQDRPETCWLEVWSKQAQTDGRRALDQLRDGVQKAIETLGTGFISHKANQLLCDRLKAGELNKQDLYRQLLRLIYRLIFLFVSEDRDLLHSPNASDEARSRYDRFYSGQRLRRMAERTHGSLHADLWVALRLVFAKLGNGGCPELGMPALGGSLFSSYAMPDLESAELSNEYLLQAVRNLGLVKDRSGWRLVDYRNLGSEELGSVYESLLELNPTMELDAGVFLLGTVVGNQRKTSGSYYTPDSLVQCLLDSALDPVVEQAIQGKSPAEAEKAILALNICDPAVGSGHFLVGAAHRLAKHLSQIRAQMLGDSEPSPLYYQRALRDVISHCLYGVDINPLAAELCRVSLWMEALEPGKPLTFLDHHIRVGNALLGATPALLAKGIPDEAFTPIEGDDKEICKRFKKINKEERAGFRRLFAATTEPWERLGDLATSMVQLDTAPDDSIEAVRSKELMYESLVRSSGYLNGQFWADSWCATFVWRKTEEFNYPITEEVFRRIEHNPHDVDGWMRDEINRLSQQFKFFHWHLAFPDVFHVSSNETASEDEQTGWTGGFDVVLGNPPWERVKLQEKEWFASRRPDIAAAQNAAARRKMIRALKHEDPAIFAEFRDSLRHADAEGQIVRNGGRYPLCAIGDINTYALFAETMKMIIVPSGRVGALLPCGIVTDDTTKRFFQNVTSNGSLVSVTGFINEEMLFPSVLHNFKFCLLVLTGRKYRAAAIDFVFNCHSLDQASDASRHFQLTFDEIQILNPNTGTAPVFFWNRSAEITKDIYSRVPVLDKGDGEGWNVSFSTLFHMSNDSGLFSTSSNQDTAPLYEGKMFYQFNHRFASYESLVEGERSHMLPEVPQLKLADPNYTVTPCYYVPRSAVEKRLGDSTARSWLLAFREITSAGLARTTIASIVPRVGTNHKTPLIILKSDREHLAPVFLSCLNSFVLDFCCRQKLGGSSLSYFIMRQLPIPGPSSFSGVCPWDEAAIVSDWINSRALELSFTAWNLAGFGEDFGVSAPFKWNEDRRFQLRAELDAAFFHIYRLGRESTEYVMDSFPLIRARDLDCFNEYRTKRVILEIYDAMAEAMRTAIPYKTRLSPPPADAAVTHPLRVELQRQPTSFLSYLEELRAATNGAWATPIGVSPDNVALFTLIDVLRLIGGPVDSERVRAAANLVRGPAIAIAFMDDDFATEWVRVIGQDAQPLAGNVIQISQFQQGTADIPWAEAVRQLKGSGAIAVGADGKWSTGARLPLTSGQNWIRGRASVAVQLLADIEPAVAERRVLAFIRSVEDGTARRAVS